MRSDTKRKLLFYI